MEFVKNPIIVHAEQWFPGRKVDGVKSKVVSDDKESTYTKFYVDTLEGEMEVRLGDWIITGIAGEKYPCKDSIFRATYSSKGP